MRTVPVRHVYRVKVDVIRHVQVEPHETQFVLFAEGDCLPLAGSVVCKDLEERSVFCVALEAEPGQ